MDKSHTEQFLRLLMENQKRIQTFILMLVPNFSDAEDILQDTISVMWNKFEHYEPGTHFAAWGIQIARNKIMNFRKKKYHAPMNFDESLLEALVDQAVMMNDELDWRLEILQGCRRKLEQRDREILRLRYEEKIKAEEISKAVNRSIHSIYKDMSRIHTQLQRCVQRALKKLYGNKSSDTGEYDIDFAGASVEFLPLDQSLDLWETLLECLEGRVSKEKFDVFQNELGSDPVKLQFYCEMIAICIGLDSYSDVSMDTIINRYSIEQLQCDCQGGQISFYSLMRWSVAAVAMFAIILSFMVLNKQSNEKPLAQLVDQDNCQWLLVDGDHETAINAGQPLHKGIYRMSEGYARLRMVCGAEITVEAPAQLELINESEVFLIDGSVAVNCPPAAYGFKLRSKTTEIVDYGTRFGVTANADGKTSTHVLEGRVSVQSAGTKNKPEMLTTDQAMNVAIDGKVAEIDCQYRRYDFDIRDRLVAIPGKRLDLADIFAGGNGLGDAAPERWISPVKGEYTVEMRYGNRYLPNHLSQVKDNPYVDCIFVPDGGEGQTKISSTGLIFANCPDTQGMYWSEMSNCNLMAMSTEGKVTRVILPGKERKEVVQSCIMMHANLGVTFDLDAIRKLANKDIVRFSSKLGIGLRAQKVKFGYPADFWVLVDGELKFCRPGMTDKDGSETVDIELAKGARFLTLVATDGGNGNGCDWSMFTEPSLILE
ncbi:MAG: sigma-70 family RNA polymerase sigma factor [Phycisphaerae bacterium]|nr:sigma-70 family RNA polymerase sigma factor [Phycisphaerae bacterium]